MSNSTHSRLSTSFFHRMCTSPVLKGKRSLCFISIVNRTVSFKPEFLCTIEISHIELARVSYIQFKNCIICNADKISSCYSFACAMLKSVVVKPTPIGPSVVVKPFTCHHIQSIYLIIGHCLAPPIWLCLAPADNPLDLASGAFDAAFCGLTPHIALDGRPFARGLMVRTAIVVLKG